MSIPSVSDNRRQRAATVAPELDRLPPNSPEAEQGVLACCLQAPDTCINASIMAIGDTVEVFYDLRHRTIYETLVAMRMDMEPVELGTLSSRLKDMKLLDQIGGIAYLSQVEDAAPSAANLSYYLDQIKEKYLVRKLIITCSGVVGNVYDFTGKSEDLLSEAEREILSIRQTFNRGRGGANIAELQAKLIDAYENAQRGMAAGIHTGFTDLDLMAGGMMGQELIIIGGTPSAGKTTLALNIAFNAASAGTIVSIKSLETSATKVVHRLHCMAGRVDSSGFLRGNVTQTDMEKMVVAISAVSAQAERLMIMDMPLTDMQLVASCRQDYANGARLFIVDMLQNVQAGGVGEFAIVTATSKCLKNIAKELNVPVIAVSSLARLETDKSGKVRKPNMHDLRQSGQIESDADKIILLHCADREQAIRTVNADVAKNKDGPLGNVTLTFFSNQFRMESSGREAQEPEPEPVNTPYSDR